MVELVSISVGSWQQKLVLCISGGDKHYLVVPEVLHLARELRVPAGGDREVADAGRKRWQGIEVSIDDVIWIRPSRIKQQDKVKKLVNPAWTLENLFNYQLSLTLSDSLSL